MQEKIQTEFKELAEEAKETLSSRSFRDSPGHRLTKNQITFAQTEYARLKTRALNLIGRSFGVDDNHYKQLLELGEHYEAYPTCVGIVDAAVYAIDSGLLFNLKSIVAAELIGDYLEQAETLLSAGYHVPAASLTGAILEDTLRQLWVKQGWTVPARTNLNSLNAELAKADEYNLLTQKQITAHADIRNNADHGNYDEFTADDVEDMLKWVRRFTEEHLA